MIMDVLVGKSTQWPAKEIYSDYGLMVINRVLYHGVAGLLNKSSMALAHWPGSVIDAIHQQAIGQGMWELRHKSVLVHLLKAFNDQAIRPIILKGTAIAYDLYDQPSGRQRGDSDILIYAHDLGKARSILRSLGFKQELSLNDDADPMSLQEGWDFEAGDGSRHTIDLHWNVMKSFALEYLFTYDESIQSVRYLPRLYEYAQSLSLVHSLLYSCAHRARHVGIPYYVNGVANVGNERVIWAYDIDLYAKALLPSEWHAFCTLAHEKGIARICLDGLQYASRCLETQFPDSVKASLMAGPAETEVWRYINEQNTMKLAFMDLLAVPGLRNKLRIIFKKLFPPAAFMRYKYKNMNHRSLSVLYCIRFFEFIFQKK
jgi:hypothetical protein